jgi:hypothetical protein
VRPPPGLRSALERSAEAARRERRQRSKPEPCVNDALDAAFDELNRRGIVAIQNAGAKVGTAPDDARADAILEAKRRRGRGEASRGFCVYGLPELERGVRGEGLRLDVGPFAKVDVAALAREVLEVLHAHGVDAAWSGASGDPLIVPPFAWYR